MRVEAKCEDSLADKVDVLRERVGVVVKIEDILTHSCQRWYGHVVCEVLIEVGGKKKNIQ